MHALSIRSRLILLFTVQIVIIFLVGGFYLDWRLRQTLERELGEKLEILARTTALQIDGELLAGLAPGDEETRTYRGMTSQLRAIRAATGVRRIYVFGPNRTSLLDTKAGVRIGAEYVFLQFNRGELAELFSAKSANSPLFSGSDGRLYKTGFAPVFADEKIVAGIGLEGSAKTLEAIVTVRRDLLVLGAVVFIGSILLGFLFSKRITSPINKLKEAARRIGRGKYESAIEVEGSDEITFLGRTMEQMRRAIVLRDTRQKAMLAGVAHEIRNPLGGIELFAGLLAEEITDSKQKSEAAKILKEARNLNKIVQDFLDYARPVKPERKSCIIQNVFDEARALLANELNKMKIACREETKELKASCDPLHLKRVFLNLLKNSAEAISGSGEIKLDINASSKFVHLTFSDTGPGILPDITSRVFDPFFTRRKNGTGLGLAIAKSLVEENGGEMRLVEGQGAVFEINLPRG